MSKAWHRLLLLEKPPPPSLAIGLPFETSKKYNPEIQKSPKHPQSL